MKAVQRNFTVNRSTNDNHKLDPSRTLSIVVGPKRRYHVMSTPLQHIAIPSSTSAAAASSSHGVSWEDWHDQAWKESTQFHHHNPSTNGFRSLQEQDDKINNYTFSTALSPPLLIRLEDEDAVRRTLLLESSSFLPLQGKIYYPRPAKKSNYHKNIRSHSTTAGSVVIPLPDLMDPPPKWKLGPDTSTMEQELPFGASLPKVQQGKEVNLRVRRSFHPHGNHNKKDPFRNHLNWATTDNPDRVPLVHDPIDQGACGSCWAYVTTGSLETSLARRVAQMVYWQQLNQSSTTTTTTTSPGNDTDPSTPTTLTTNATTPPNTTTTKTKKTNSSSSSRRKKKSALVMAQWVESLVFNQTRLSIQELLDCDTQIDQGCVGGNPLLAFFYIHQFGLTSWENYPYAGIKLDTCARSDRRDVSQYNFPSNNNKGRGGGGGRASSASTSSSSSSTTTTTLPFATVDSWGILPKNHEDLIQIALRYIGPVAVAINGGDDDFIRYAGGIFDKESCSQEANHAVLIVGYGQEEFQHKDDTEIIRYWIARNSWGPLWGENGYIRIARGSGKKKVPGICGIARSPSVALGGRLLVSPWLSSQGSESDADGKSSGGNDGWWLDLNGGGGGGANGMDTLSDQDVYQDFVNKEWPQLCNAITPMDTLWHVGCRRIIHVFDNHRAASLGVMSLLVLLLLAFLLTYPCRVRQERRKKLLRRRQQLQQQQEQQQGEEPGRCNEEEQDPSGHGSLSLSSDEEATGAGQFAILEDDLEVENNHNHDEKAPLLRMPPRMVSQQQQQQHYGSLVDHDDTSRGGGSGDNVTTGSSNNKNNQTNGGPISSIQPPPKESNEVASSLFSTSSGRSWFFLQK